MYYSTRSFDTAAAKIFVPPSFRSFARLLSHRGNCSRRCVGIKKFQTELAEKDGIGWANITVGY